MSRINYRQNLMLLFKWMWLYSSEVHRCSWVWDFWCRMLTSLVIWHYDNDNDYDASMLVCILSSLFTITMMIILFFVRICPVL